MAERRTLIEGLKQTPAVEPDIERDFVFKKPAPIGEGADRALPVATSTSSTAITRAPISSRVRSEYAAALKRASLERQLAKVEPNSISDILDDAIELWLRTNGCLS